MSSSLSIMMLSWRAHKTLRQTLRSYAETGLPTCGDEFFVYFNEVCEADRSCAAEFGVDARGSAENLGIWGAMDRMAREAGGDLLLFLQNDHLAVVPRGEVEHWIGRGRELVDSGQADIVLLWNRFERVPGWGTSHYFDYHFVHDLDPRAASSVRFFPTDWNRDTFARRLHRFLRPKAALRHMNAGPFLEREPEKVFPRFVRKEGDVYLIDSQIQPFTESPFLISKGLYRELSDWSRLHARKRKVNGAPVMEHALNCDWWRNRHFQMAVCDGGVFGHRRADDSWRSDSASYNSDLSQACSGGVA